jgi:hypothetical protein
MLASYTRVLYGNNAFPTIIDNRNLHCGLIANIWVPLEDGGPLCVLTHLDPIHSYPANISKPKEPY